VKLKFDKNLVASLPCHVLVLGYGLVSFSSRSLKRRRRNRCRVDIISADSASPRSPPAAKTGEKDKPKPLAEKVADESRSMTSSARSPKSRRSKRSRAAKAAVEKPVEKNPIRQKPVAENKPR